MGLATHRPVRLLGAVVLVCISAVASHAEEHTPNRVTLDEAMSGATAMTQLQGQYIFIARPDGGYVCGINLNDRFFPGAIQDDSGATAFANRPGAICLTARLFEDLGADASNL